MHKVGTIQCSEAFQCFLEKFNTQMAGRIFKSGIANIVPCMCFRLQHLSSSTIGHVGWSWLEIFLEFCAFGGKLLLRDRPHTGHICLSQFWFISDSRNITPLSPEVKVCLAPDGTLRSQLGRKGGYSMQSTPWKNHPYYHSTCRI